MKKSLAAGSAVALGFAGAAAPLAIAPAEAAPTTPCATYADITSVQAFDNAYQNCVPQFGMGKVEFTISSEVDFPAGFKDLTDPDVTITTTSDLDAMQTYFATKGYLTAPFEGLLRTDDGTNPKLQRYSAASYDGSPGAGTSYFAISSISKGTSSDVSAACLNYGLASDFADVYVVNFVPLDVTFSQTVNGENWTFHVVMTPEPTIVAGTILGGDWSTADELCISQGTFVAGAATRTWDWDTAFQSIGPANPYPSNLWGSDPDAYFVGDYPRYVPAPDLPNTGVSAVAGAFGAGLVLLGGLTLGLVRRRRA